jgi:hypothetical protein
MSRFAIEQQRLAVPPHQKIEQMLALRAQQGGVAGQGASHIVGDEALQESGDILALIQRREAH